MYLLNMWGRKNFFSSYVYICLYVFFVFIIKKLIMWVYIFYNNVFDIYIEREGERML